MVKQTLTVWQDNIDISQILTIVNIFHQDQINLKQIASEVIRDDLRFWENNEELVQLMKLEVSQKRLAVGAGQAKQGQFVDQSVSDIISEAKNIRYIICLHHEVLFFHSK